MTIKEIAVDVEKKGHHKDSERRGNITSIGTLFSMFLQTGLHCSAFEKFFHNHKGFFSFFFFALCV